QYQQANLTVNEFISGISNLLLIMVGASLVLNNQISIGILVAVAAYRYQFSQKTSTLIEKIFEFRMLRLHGEKLADILLSLPEDGRTLKATIDSSAPPNIEICDVWFRHTEFDPQILRGINLAIKAGESVAITGPSGCGKSTLFNILTGTLDRKSVV